MEDDKFCFLHKYEIGKIGFLLQNKNINIISKIITDTYYSDECRRKVCYLLIWRATEKVICPHG